MSGGRRTELVRTRIGVTGFENLDQHGQAAAQWLDTLHDQMNDSGVVRTRPDANCEIDRSFVHVRKELPDQGTGMLGMKRAVPFQGLQQLLPDGIILRMAPGAQARSIKRFGFPVKSAEQLPPLFAVINTDYATAPNRCRGSRKVQSTLLKEEYRRASR